MVDALKEAVHAAREALLHAAVRLPSRLVISAIDRNHGTIVIMDHHAVVLEVGLDDDSPEPAELPAHRVLYKACPDLGAIIDAKSHYATCWAQARMPIPCLGTSHADFFGGEIPVTRALTEVEVEGEYAYHLGKVITRQLDRANPFACPAILVAGDGPYVWGRTVEEAVEHALALEEVAMLAFHTLQLNRDAMPLEGYTQERRFHGPPALQE